MEELIQKAKNTIYKNKDWFIGGDKNIFEAISYFVECNDFIIDYKKNLTTYDVSALGYDGYMSHNAVLKWLIENKHYNLLKIVFTGSEGGSDRGILKIKLFLYLKESNREVLE